MNTRPTHGMQVRWFGACGALVLAVALFASGAALANDVDDQPIDPATEAAWLAEHFRCEHGTAMTETMPIDPATEAAWLAEHFRCEHGTGLEDADDVS